MSGSPVGNLLHPALSAAFVLLQALLAIYALHRTWMVRLFYRRRAAEPDPPMPAAPWPMVTVQLPVHDEIYVIERLIDAACALDYPKDRLEIQILDDSTDETTALAEKRAALYRHRGVDVRVLHRERRSGFKAGALNRGLVEARGELIAIFDADFLPRSDFLRRVVPPFRDPEVGMVQTRWEHANLDYSWLTGVQAVFLDSHFLIEQQARARSGRFFNFNGTAGVWRRTAIESAGGWRADTLTEDLELSYRAQLAGWRFRFLSEVLSPAELPVDIHAFKSQQRRWAKGSIQTARKMLPRVWASALPWATKVEASFHLTSNLSYLLVLISGALAPLVLLGRDDPSPWQVAAWSSVLLAGTASVCLFFAVSQRARGRSWLRAATSVPGALALGMGMSLNQARAVLEGGLGGIGAWERTPKYAIVDRGQTWKHKRYAWRAPGAGFGEASLAAFFGLGTVLAVTRGQLTVVPFLVMLATGSAVVAWLSLRSRPLGKLSPRSVSEARKAS